MVLSFYSCPLPLAAHFTPAPHVRAHFLLFPTYVQHFSPSKRKQGFFFLFFLHVKWLSWRKHAFSWQRLLPLTRGPINTYQKNMGTCIHPATLHPLDQFICVVQVPGSDGRVCAFVQKARACRFCPEPRVNSWNFKCRNRLILICQQMQMAATISACLRSDQFLIWETAARANDSEGKQQRDLLFKHLRV